MIIVAGSIFLLALLGFLGLGICYPGPWKYRSVKRILVFCKRKSWMIPKWMDREILLRVWIGIIGTSLIAFVILLLNGSSKVEVFQVEKPEYGQGAMQEELELAWENENGEFEQERIQIQINEKRLTSEEIDGYFQSVKEQLPEIMLGENESTEYVNQPLNLVEQIEDIPAQISWMSSNTEIIDMTGNLGMEISQDGERVCLKAVIQIQEQEETYIQYVNVYPPKLSITEQLQYWLEKQSENTEQRIQLPEQWEGMELTWSKHKTNEWLGIVILLLSCPVFYVMKCRQDYEDKMKIRREQLLQDYPRLLSKLTLLLSAGLNLRKSIERIGNDYVKYKKEGEHRVAYEEIIELSKEMERGVTEKEAYERFGERCQILPYRTLAALLIQYLQKGGDDIQRILEEECKRAQESRIQQAKIIGEQVSTKLLFPMILMLVIVFVIVLVPAWISFSV